eukprot:GEMP01043971.1.p1 GENE.GEMP01043971.1~~GEMP01043971.1.p1  ORF type:complete len:290 (+),score=60.55 GEMP01043971.1:60-929(+)
MVNWPGLLAWSSKYHDGTAEISKFTAMSKEDRAFLQTAMEEMFSQIEDPNKIFKEAVDKLRDCPNDEETMTTLEIIDRCCDDPDVPRNLEVHDGLTPMLALLDRPNSSIVARTCEVLGLMLANNDKMQRAAFEKNALDKLMTCHDWTDTIRCRGKVRLLTATVRNEPHIEEEFVKRDGIEFLGQCMKCGDEKTVTRAASMLSHLVQMERTTATATTSSYLARAYTDLRTASIQSGETLAFCAKAHSGIESKELRDGMKERVKYIYEQPTENVKCFKHELEVLLETMKSI